MVDLDHQEAEEGRASKNSFGKENETGFNSKSKALSMKTLGGNFKGSL